MNKFILKFGGKLQLNSARAFFCCKIFLIFLTIFSVAFGFLISPKPSVAQQQNNSFVTIVNPVRGPDFFTGAPNPLDTPKGQLEVISKNNLPATWVLRFDAYNNSEIASFFKKVPQNQELGIFFEITPTLTQAAGVTYNQSDVWHKAKSVFLTGYTFSDRKKLITTAFEKFRETFGFYPKSVGAWWIDANSLNFMREKYGITTNLTVSDQFSTDDYQVWGMPFSTAFYPSKKNALVPAQSTEAKIGTVAIQWAQRDPFNGYGPGVQESTYSVQANDYTTSHNFKIDYFEKLLDLYSQGNFYNQFGQATVGLENTFSWEGYAAEFTNQINAVAKRKSKGQLSVVTMSQFASWYQNTFPNLSPSNLISTDDPLGKSGKVVWFNSNYYRVGWFYRPEIYGSAIRDLRLYNDSLPEPCYETACSNLDLGLSVSKPLDEATFGDRWTIDEGQISDFKIEKAGSDIKFSYKNAAGKSRTVVLKERDLVIDGEGVAVSEAILRALNLTESQKNNISLNLTEGKFEISAFGLFKSSLVFLGFTALLIFSGLVLVDLLKFELSELEKFVVGTILSLVSFVVLSFLFGWVKLQFLAFVFLAVFFLFGIFKIPRKFNLTKLSLNRTILILGILLIVGTAVQVITVVKSGLLYDFGLGFWGPNGHDAVWHLAVIESLTKHFPPQNPILAGELLRNYHYFYDFLSTQTFNLTKIPVVDLYFRYFPILISALFGLTVFVVTKKIAKSETAALLAVFLSYFGGSFGWIVSLIRKGDFGGESMFWANQAISFHLNPPFAISVLIFLAGLLLFHKYLENKNSNYSLFKVHNSLFAIAILWGSLIMFKAYAGVLVLAGLIIVSLWELFFKKQNKILKLTILTAVISAIVFLPNNFGSSNFLIFSPFWFIHTMAEYQDRLFWLKLANARNAYIQMHWWWKLILVEILGLIIFIVGNLGTRILVFGQVINLIKCKFRIEPFVLFLVSFSACAVLIPLLFIQRGTAWNTIQFFYYFQVVSGIFAAVFFWQLISRFPRFLQVLSIVILILLTIPTTIGTALQYLPSRAPARLPFGEFQALEFLKNQPAGVVLTKAFDKTAKDKFDLPLPLSVYETTAYVSAFSGKPTYIEDEINLEIIGADYKERVIGAKEFFRTSDENFQKDFLRKNKIKYIYVAKFERFGPSETHLGIKKIFENDEVKIYEVS